MTTKRTFLVAALLTFFCIASPQLSAQQSTPDRPALSNIVFNGDMAALLAQLAEINKVNIGLETDPRQPLTNVKMEFRFTTVDELMEGVIKAAPGYRWRNQNGFIDVYPSDAGCPLLETAVSDFHADNTNWLAAVEALINSSEVGTEMNVLGLTRLNLDHQTAPTNLFSVSLKNVSLRQALHEITKSSKNSFWMFKRSGNRGQNFSISTAPF